MVFLMGWHSKISAPSFDESLLGGTGFAQSKNGKPADEARSKLASAATSRKARGFVATITRLIPNGSIRSNRNREVRSNENLMIHREIHGEAQSRSETIGR
jgi:hypothetical protein